MTNIIPQEYNDIRGSTLFMASTAQGEGITKSSEAKLSQLMTGIENLSVLNSIAQECINIGEIEFPMETKTKGGLKIIPPTAALPQ